MRKVAVGIAAAVLMATSAFATTVKKKPPDPRPPAPSWTGFYIGANVGGAWGRANTGFTSSGTATSTNFPSVSVAHFDIAGSRVTALSGFIGGSQIGYNYQLSRKWVFGFETDLQGSGERASGSFVNSFTGSACLLTIAPPPSCLAPTSLNGSAAIGYETRIEWFGTVRGRLGMLVADQLLLYGTAGLAYGHVSVSGNVNIGASSVGPGPITYAGTSGFSASATNVGFAVGGGVEGRFIAWLPPNWTWKFEYLYVDLGSLDASTAFGLAASNPVFSSPLAGAASIHTHFTDNIARVGLNYQFH